MSSDVSGIGPVPFPATPAFLLIAGTRVGRFVVDHAIGAGGMGIVYLAMQDEPRRWCALKVLQNQHSRLGSAERFKREVAALGRLNHPAIATIYDAGIHSAGGMSVPYFAMELVEGGLPITKFCTDRELGVEAILDLFRDVCLGLRHVHEMDVVHRDLKPSNILIRPDGTPKIIDFGIAALTVDQGSALTMTGSVVGTVRYMAPEQLHGAAPDIRSDVFSLAVILYELLCRTPPFGQAGASGVLPNSPVAHQATPLPRTVPQGLDPELYAVLCKALELSPADRYATVAQLQEDLAKVRRGELPDAAVGLRRRVWTKRIRRGSRYLPRAVAVGLILLAHSAGQYGGWFVDARGFAPTYAGWLLRSLNYVPDAPPADVRIVRLSDSANYDALASKLLIPGFDPKSLQSLRLLHAKMHARLRAAGAKTIAWDITFVGASRFDGPLAAEWKRSADAGSPPIAARDLLPKIEDVDIAPLLRGSALLGITSCARRDTGDWQLDLAVQRESKPLVASFALLAYADFSGKGDRVRSIWPSWIVMGKSTNAGAQPEVAIGNADPTPYARADVGINSGDLVAQMYPEMPPPPVFAKISYDYDAVALASDEQLKEWFSGKLVIVGDGRKGRDGPTVFPNGSSYFGFEAQAQSCQQLIEGHMPMTNSHARGLGTIVSRRELLEIIATAIGAILGWWAGKRLWQTAVVTAGGAVLVGLAFVASYQFFGWLASPSQAAIGLTSACLFLGIHRRALLFITRS